MRLSQINQIGITLLPGWNSLVVFAQELSFEQNITLQERQRVAKAIGFDQIRADDRRAGVITPTKLTIAKVDLSTYTGSEEA